MISFRHIRLGLQQAARLRYLEERVRQVQAKHRGKLTDEEARFEVEREDAEAAAAKVREKSEVLLREDMAARAGIAPEDANLL